jgi:hypothetical protein
MFLFLASFPPIFTSSQALKIGGFSENIEGTQICSPKKLQGIKAIVAMSSYTVLVHEKESFW